MKIRLINQSQRINSLKFCSVVTLDIDIAILLLTKSRKWHSRINLSPHSRWFILTFWLITKIKFTILQIIIFLFETIMLVTISRTIFISVWIVRSFFKITCKSYRRRNFGRVRSFYKVTDKSHERRNLFEDNFANLAKNYKWIEYSVIDVFLFLERTLKICNKCLRYFLS